MPQEAPVALGIRTPSLMQTLGSVMDVGNKMLKFKRAQATLPYAAPMAAAQTSTAQTGAQAAHFQLTTQQQQYGRQLLAGTIQSPSVINGDPKGIMAHLNNIEAQGATAGIPPSVIQSLVEPLKQLTITNPKAVREALITRLTQSISGPAQAEAMSPRGPVLSNGQETIPTNTSITAGPIGAVPGMTTQQVPSPTTPVIGPTGAPGLYGAQPTVGAQPTGTPQLGAPSQPGDVATGYAPGIVPMATGVANTASQDYQHVMSAANVASRGIGFLGQIQEQVKSGALTGVGAEQRAFVSGIGGLLGLPNTDLTNSQVIAKQVAMLTGMNPNTATDMGKQIAQMSVPHNGMSAEAIRQVGDELRAQFQLNIKEQQILQPFLGNPEAYMHARALVNHANNPMVLLYANGNAAQRARIMKGYATPEAQKIFENQLNAASALGIIGPPSEAPQ